MAAADAHDYVADLRNLPEWDPGVVTATQAEGAGIDLGAVYEVTLARPPRYRLRYEVTEHDPGRSTTLIARSRIFTSIDRVEAVPADDGSGSVVTYDAELRLNGILRVADPALRIAFERIGDRAAAGLRAALEGEFVE